MTTLIFIPSLNTKMSFIVLEKGILLETFSRLNFGPNLAKIWRPVLSQATDRRVRTQTAAIKWLVSEG